MAKMIVHGADAARIVASIINKEATIASRKIAYRLAARFAGRVRAKIFKQEESWHPLSPDYLTWKLRNRLSPNILVARRRYAETIRPRLSSTVGSSKFGGYEVAPSTNPIAGGESTTFLELGIWHEFGTRYKDGSQKMPARPHFRPTWKEFRGELEDQIRRFSDEIGEAIAPQVDSNLGRASSRAKTYRV